MSCLTLRKKNSDKTRISLEGIVPDRLQHLSATDIETLPIVVSDKVTSLKTQFDVLDGDRSILLLTGDLSHCDFVAGGMQDGELIVESTVGDFLAAGMKAGRVLIMGNAGAYACSSLRGGHVAVRGDVGEYAAAAAPKRSWQVRAAGY